MIQREMQLFHCTREEVMERMAHAYDIMKHAAERALRENLVSCGQQEIWNTINNILCICTIL